MKYYIKKISKQDKTRTFVINIDAIKNYFNLKINEKNDEDYINIIYPDTKKIEQVKIVMKQDPRCFIDRDYFNINDLIIFNRRYDKDIDLCIYKIIIIQSNSNNYKNLNWLLKNNYLITNQIKGIIKESESTISQNQPIKVSINVRKK
tara:strand:- start:616 stop:1059 length:444 start_codon:yes stop_codon:yes gene_type:complete